MATKEERRIFIGGLVKGVTEEELMEKFSRFGQVGQLEIKTRTSDLDTKTFAYLNLTAEENDFKKCFTAYNNTKWKGGQLKLQFAKESFISKLKREQEEAKQEAERGDCKPAAASTSPALEAHNKKAVPGTPMDEKGNWVMGKYSRVLPVLHVKKPSSRKIITYDPSKMTHSLKRLKCDDASSAENGGNLTWQLEENESEITKRRQGQFPSWQAPRKESIFSRLHGLAMEENISDTEMEVVPVGKMTSHSKMPFASGCGYESSDSAGSADTDEILSKASRKTSSERTPSSITKSPHEKLSERTPSSITKSPHEKVSERAPSSVTKSPHEKLSERTPSSITKSPHEKLSERTPSSITKSPHEKVSERTPSSIIKSPHKKLSERTPCSITKSPHEKVSERTPSSIIKSPHKKLSERTPCSITKSPHENLPERTPSRAKNCQSKASPVKTSSGKDYESDGSNSGDDADLEETPTLTKVPSKKKATDSTSLSGPSVRKKAPVDSSDSDSDSEAAEAGQGPQFKFVKSKTVQGRCLKKSAKMSQPKTPPFRGLGMLSSDEDNNGEEERMKVSTPSSEKKAPKTNSLAKKQAPKSLENMPLRGRGDGLLLISSPERRSEKLQNASSKLNRKTSQDLKSVGSPNSSTSQLFQQKRVSEDCEDTDDALTAMRTPKRKEQELSKMIIEEFASGIEEGSPLASSSHKSQRSGLEGSDDSDLDDNDFELVGKKLEARAKQQQDKRTKRDKSQRGTNLDSTSSTAPGIHGTKKMKESVGDVRLEGELTSMQKSHQARKRNQEEVKKKENIITKSIREGTDSKHITFSDTEEDKSVRSEQKPALFEDSDFDEENNDFYIRPQFHGKKGRKLMELQSKDIRFRIDQRFAESDSEEEEEERTTDKDSGDELMAQEKARNMQILEKVLGFKPRERKRNLYQDMNQRRYIDPITSKHLEQTASVTEGETHTRKKKHDQVQNDNDNNAGGDDAEEEEEEEEGTSEEEEDGEEDAGDDDSDEEEEEEEDTEEEEEESEKEEESKDGIGGAHSQGEEDSKAEEKDSGKNDRDENDEQDSEDDDDGGNQDAAEEDSDDDTGGSAEEEEDSDDDTGASAEEEEDSAKEEQSGAGEGDDSAMVTDSKANTSSKLADLFAGGSSFAFFGTPAADAEPSITLSQLEDKDDDEDEEMEDLEEAEPAPSPPRVAETDILQPSFILNGLDHRLKAAVRFFKRPAEEEFQEMVEGWPDKRQKIMQLVRDRHKRALRKERKAQRQEQWQKKQIRRKRFKK